jgi:large subunit ribosomal protein L35
MAKLKLKNNSGAKKRFRATASGKIKRKRNHLAHILTKHPRKVKRRYRKKTYVDESDAGHIRALVPYGL